MATRTDRLRVEQDSTDVRAEGYLIRLVEHLDDT
jgi:hypothetical protein